MSLWTLRLKDAVAATVASITGHATAARASVRATDNSWFTAPWVSILCTTFHLSVDLSTGLQGDLQNAFLSTSASINAGYENRRELRRICIVRWQTSHLQVVRALRQIFCRAASWHSDPTRFTMAAEALRQGVRVASPWCKMQAQPSCHSLNSLIPAPRAAWSILLVGKKKSKATAPSSALWSQSLAAACCQNSSGDNLHSSPGWSQLLVIGGHWFCLETWSKHATFETRAMLKVCPLSEPYPKPEKY